MSVTEVDFKFNFGDTPSDLSRWPHSPLFNELVVPNFHEKRGYVAPSDGATRLKSRGDSRMQN